MKLLLGIYDSHVARFSVLTGHEYPVGHGLFCESCWAREFGRFFRISAFPVPTRIRILRGKYLNLKWSGPIQWSGYPKREWGGRRSSDED